VRIVGGRIDWVAHADNNPTVWLTVEDWPREYVYMAVPSDSRDGRGVMYFAENAGACRYYWYRGPSQGFGGSIFTLRLNDGSSVDLKGPWSSRAGCINALGLGPVVDVTLTGSPPLAATVTLVVLEAALPLIEVPDYLPPAWMGVDAMRFPTGTHAALRRIDRDEREFRYEPYAVLPDGTTWLKPDRISPRNEPRKYKASFDLSGEQDSW
jgi:hypothetical protein